MEAMNMNEYNAWIGGIARRYKHSQTKASTLFTNLVNDWCATEICDGDLEDAQQVVA